MNAIIRHTLITAAALCCLSAQTAWASTESTIKEGREAAEQYKDSAKKECAPMSGNAQDVCEAKVNVLYTRMDSMLKAEDKGTFKAYYDAKIDIAKAEHKLAHLAEVTQLTKPTELDAKRAVIEAALARARARRQSGE